MSPSEQNAEIAKCIFAALDAGDIAPIAPYLHSQSVLQFRGDSALAGRHEGQEAIATLLGRFASLTKEMGGKLELFQVIPGEEHAIARFHLSASRGEQSLQTIGCQVARLKNGQITEVWYSFDEPYGFDACFK